MYAQEELLVLETDEREADGFGLDDAEKDGEEEDEEDETDDADDDDEEEEEEEEPVV